MGKVHYYDGSILENAPADIKQGYYRNGEDGAACGYVRKNTTLFTDKVTCFYCKKEMQRKGLLDK